MSHFPIFRYRDSWMISCQIDNRIGFWIVNVSIRVMEPFNIGVRMNYYYSMSQLDSIQQSLASESLRKTPILQLAR